ncbi:MAG: protein kinase [bacterium]|nr:protein kinase [bacterium]
MTDPDKPDSDPELSDLDESALDRALDGAFGAAGDAANREAPSPTPSVIERIGEVTGSKPKVSLRDAEEPGQTPMLKPLGPDDARDAGKYVIQGELGRGGVGAVHRGHDQDLGRDVAMKFLHAKYKDEPAILHRFVEEAQIGGQLQHPGIVPVYELGMSDGRPFFTMKMVKGQTLAQALSDRRSSASDRRRFLAIFEQICQTMAYAHARGVVHRDLKPANVMIGSFGEVQVVDWGMGKVLKRGGVADEKRAAELQSQLSVIETVRSAGHGTQSIMGSVMGTPAYMPPEQARGDVDAMDARSDVFALGAILCEILTGQPPYVGEQSDLITMAAMAKLDDAQARLAASGADDDLIELATECLMPAPAARPQSAEAVASRIHEHLGAAEARAHDANIRAAALKRTQKLGIALTVVIAAGLGASLWFWRDADTQRGVAEKAASDAKTAEQAEKTAREAAETNLANFNRLSHVVRLESAKAKEVDLFPAWPSKSEAMRSWLDTDAKDLVGVLPKLRSTLAELEARALPQSEEDKAEEREKRPRSGELKALEAKLTAMRYAQDVRNGHRQPEPFALEEAKLPKTHDELNNLAWALVDPGRTEFGREAEGLALARRAVSAAPASGDDRAMVTDTLAWALFANGLDDEALAKSKEALAAASASKRADYSGYLKKLEATIATASGDEGQRAITDLAQQVAALDAEVSTRTDWQFEDDADRFLHATLRKLVADIKSFEEANVAQVKKRLTWSERVEKLTISRYDERWKEARLAIIKADGKAASELYGEVPVELSPQMGLVPIGMNPKTKLWEFYHLRSAWDGTSDPSAITIPSHREDGSIEVTADTGIVFVLLPGATFWMGAQATDPNGPNYDKHARPDVAPRQVYVPPFFLGRHELSQGQWARLWSGEAQLRRPSSHGLGFRGLTMTAAVDDSHPVENVDWTMSSETMARHGLSLPTEAQWEYGCHGTTNTPYWFDFADLNKFANVADATAKRAGAPWTCEAWSDGHIIHAPVGTFGANLFGLHDVHGNVWEWCQSTFDSSSRRVLRGGGFGYPAVFARSTNRDGHAPTIRDGGLGLRPARLITK